jgi:hypothetical protein
VDNSGIFEESVQRVTLAVGETAATEGGPAANENSQQQQPAREEEDEEDMVEDIMREVLETENRQRRQRCVPAVVNWKNCFVILRSVTPANSLVLIFF